MKTDSATMCHAYAFQEICTLFNGMGDAIFVEIVVEIYYCNFVICCLNFLNTPSNLKYGVALLNRQINYATCCMLIAKSNAF